MDKFQTLIKTNEEKLIEYTLECARRYGYAKFTAPRREDWQTAIHGLSESLLSAFDASQTELNFGPNYNSKNDPIIAFGVKEAQRHRARGVTLSMFLGMMKYFRQSYLDLVRQSHLTDKEKYSNYIYNFFDRMEIGFCAEWTQNSDQVLQNELQMTNRELAIEKNKYITLLDSLPDPIFLLNHLGQTLEMNQAAKKLYQSEQLTSPVDQWLNLDAVNLSQKNESSFCFDREVDFISGKRFFSICVNGIWWNNDHTSKYYLVRLTDLTDRQKKERALQLFRNLIDHLMDMVFIVDPQTGQILDVNDTACQRLGYSRKELLSLNINQIDIEAYTGRSHPQLIHMLKTMRTLQIEGRHRCKEGSTYPVEVDLQYVAQDQREYVIANARDISDRREMENKLTYQIAFLQTVIDSIAMPVFIKNPQHRYVGCNRAFEQLTGYTRDQIIGKTAFDLFTRENAEVFYQSDIALFQEMKIQMFYGSFQLPRNETHEVVFVKTPFYNSDGQLGGLVGTVLDCTQIVKLREEFMQMQKFQTKSQQTNEPLSAGESK